MSAQATPLQSLRDDVDRLREDVRDMRVGMALYLAAQGLGVATVPEARELGLRKARDHLATAAGRIDDADRQQDVFEAYVEANALLREVGDGDE